MQRYLIFYTKPNLYYYYYCVIEYVYKIKEDARLHPLSCMCKINRLSLLFSFWRTFHIL